MPTFNIKKKDEEPTPTIAELSVKGKYADSNRLVSYLNDRISERDNFVLKMLWEQDYEFKQSDMFDYVIKIQVHRPYKGLTEIKNYTNRSGRTDRAHFNGSSYMGSVVKLGTKPVACDKWGVPNREGWTINGNGKFVKS
jgi:hypothetical protein